MANRRVRLVRSVKINGKAVFCAPETTPKGSISSEIVLYKGQRLKIPASEGRWYIRWEEGNKPKWQRAASMTEAIGLRVRKRMELQAVAAGVEVKPDNPSRLRLSDALQQFIADLELQNRQKKTVGAYRIMIETFQKSCHRTYLDQVDRRDLLRYADSLRKDGLSERTISNRWNGLMTVLKANGITGLTKRGDAPVFVESEPEAYSEKELDKFFRECNAEYRLLFSFYLKTGFRMQEVMYLQYSDLDFVHHTASVKAKPAYGFIPKRWHERTIPLEKELAKELEMRRSERKASGLVFPTRTGKPNTKHLLALKRIAKRAGLDETQFFLHKFRATAATNWLRGGIDLRTVQSLLGHSSLESTIRYLKPLSGSDLHKKLNGLYVPGA
jgi:integrase